MAANAVPSTSSSVLSAALLDYNHDLHVRAFKRLAGPWRIRAARALKGLARLAAAAGACLHATRVCVHVHAYIHVCAPTSTYTVLRGLKQGS
jgi:hypothetical protein